MLLTRALSLVGLRCIEATNGNETIRALNEHHPALLLLDISMPYPDGLTVLRKMRQDPVFRETPVILCTVEDSPTVRDAAIELNAFAHLVKPISSVIVARAACDALGIEQPEQIKAG